MAMSLVRPVLSEQAQFDQASHRLHVGID